MGHDSYRSTVVRERLITRRPKQPRRRRATLRLVAAGATLGRRRRRRKLGAARAAAAASRWRLAPRSDALQVRDGQSARAARQSTPPHPSDIKPTILCGLNLIPYCSSRDMDFNARKIRVWNITIYEFSVKRFENRKTDMKFWRFE